MNNTDITDAMHAATDDLLSRRKADPELAFHAGELEVQRKRGSLESAYDMVILGGFVEKHMDSDVQSFVGSVTFMILSALDPATGAVYTTIAQGVPGEYAKPAADGMVISVGAFAAADDPVLTLLKSGAETQIGVIAIEPEFRQRHRLSGVATLDGTTVSMKLRRSWFNCPKYIRARKVAPPPVAPTLGPGGGVVTRAKRALNAAEMALVRASDTFYIGSAEPNAGCDASHRGGRPGFCRVSEDGTTIRYGEYNGNGTNMTLGNLVAYGQCCLLFIDHNGGAMLQLSGKGSLEYVAEHGAACSLDGSDCSVTVVVDEVCRVDQSALVTTVDVEDGTSPYNPPLSGQGAAPAAEAAGYGAGVEYVLARAEAACADGDVVKTFHFAPLPGVSPDEKVVQRVRAHTAGQFVTLTYPALGDAIRSYTIASSPRDSAAGGFAIAVKRKPGGLVSNWLHDTPASEVRVRVHGVDGGPMVLTPEDVSRPVLLLSAGVGITPMLANLRAARDTPGATPPKFTLLQSDRTAAHTVALEELRDMERSGVLGKVILVETHGEASKRVGRAHLEASLPADRDVTVLLCGPEQFMYPTKRALIDDMGVDASRIRFDDFTF